MKVTFVLDNVRSAFNVGSVFRTADGLGFNIHLIGITPIPGQDKKLEKTSLKSLDYVDNLYFRSHDDWIQYIQNINKLILVVENYDTEKTISIFDIPDFIDLQGYANIFIVLGHEINGVGNPIIGIADYILRIPMYGRKNSLNVATCAGIVGYFIKLGIFRQSLLKSSLWQEKPHKP